jgi:flagellar biosynthetic protein FliQ
VDQVAEGDIAALTRDAVMITLKLGGPPLLAGLLVGLVVSVIQAVTQIHEQTLAFIPKLVVLFAVIVLLAPFMVSTLTDYTRLVFDRIAAVGTS